MQTRDHTFPLINFLINPSSPSAGKTTNSIKQSTSYENSSFLSSQILPPFNRTRKAISVFTSLLTEVTTPCNVFSFYTILLTYLLLLTYSMEQNPYLLTYSMEQNPYLLTPWSRILREQLNGFQTFKEFPAFYETRKFITAFTSARHLSLS